MSECKQTGTSSKVTVGTDKYGNPTVTVAGWRAIATISISVLAGFIAYVYLTA